MVKIKRNPSATSDAEIQAGCITEKKSQKDLVGLSSKSIVNQLHALIERKPLYDMHGLVEENWFKWFFRNLANIGNTHYAYQSYLKPSENNGIFRIKDFTGQPVTIAVLSDWASDTVESCNIAKLVGQVDYSIHLGDTYYVGNYKEIANNFNTTIGGSWPYGASGSFALLGNHEMYSSGRSYFKQLLPYMGTHSDEGKQTQEASFFCLENDHWRIIGLDTGYDSLRGILGIKPNYKLKLHSRLIEWLTNTVKLDDPQDKRGIILLCHHQYISEFEQEYPYYGEQLSALLNPGKTILWFWGHEHRLSLYGANQLPNGARFYSRCIGHGGMPVEIIGDKDKKHEPRNGVSRNLVLFDQRIRNRINQKINLGHNGFAQLNLADDELVVQYFDDNNNVGEDRRLLVSETWSIDLDTGTLAGKSIKLEDAQPGNELTICAELDKAIH
jgi:hypothetical protein